MMDGAHPRQVIAGTGRGRRAAAVAAIGVLVAGCMPVYRGQTLTWGEALASMLAFFIAFAAIWIFIWVFLDLFRRPDLSGIVKAGWALGIVVFPLLGSLLYIGLRPRRSVMPSFDREPASTREMSTAEQMAELDRLRAAGKITDAEYESYRRDAGG
jgi:Phospholipase_D-nuclease N-terminal